MLHYVLWHLWDGNLILFHKTLVLNGTKKMYDQKIINDDLKKFHDTHLLEKLIEKAHDHQNKTFISGTCPDISFMLWNKTPWVTEDKILLIDIGKFVI